MSNLRRKIYHQIFVRPDDRGRLSTANRILILVIVAAVIVSVLGTEPSIVHEHRPLILALEMGFGAIFLIEYIARVWASVEMPGPGSNLAKRLRFIFSPLALIDLVVVVASLLPFFISDAAVLRVIRLMRLVALAKFTRLSHAFELIAGAIYERRYEFAVTIALASTTLLFGATGMYWVEGSIQPDKFGSIPRALWWSVITLTTVGYGDVSPVTPVGKFLAAVVALGSVALVAMPAGIMASAFSDAMQRRRAEQEAEKNAGPDA